MKNSLNKCKHQYTNKKKINNKFPNNNNLNKYNKKKNIIKRQITELVIIKKRKKMIQWMKNMFYLIMKMIKIVIKRKK